MGRAKEWVVQQKTLLQRIGAVALALALWQLLAMAVGQQLLVPTPLSVLQRLGTIWREDGFWSTIWFTFRKNNRHALLPCAASSLPGSFLI